jgi:alkane 1-monooxygenase
MVIGCEWKGIYTFGAAAFLLVFMAVCDLVEYSLRKLGIVKPIFLAPLRYKQAAPPPLVLMWMYTLVSGISLFYAACTYGQLNSGWEKFAHINSMGITALILLAAVHEEGHKRDTISQIVSVMGASIAFSHTFLYEHYSVHHAYAASPKDPQTAPLGESFYSFLLRVVRTNYFRHWYKMLHIHEKLTSPDKHVGYALCQVVIFAVYYKFGGLSAIFAHIVQGVIADVYLELLSYIEHYGMLRRTLANGQYEAVTMLNTAWDSDYFLTNIVFWQLGRHAEHHFDSQKLYSVYENLHVSPKLPYGLMIMHYIALIPPLWFYVMDNRVMALREEIAKTQPLKYTKRALQS